MFPIDITYDMPAGVGFKEYTVIGAIAGALDDLGVGGELVINRVINQRMREISLPQIRNNIFMISERNGCKYITRDTLDGLLVIRKQ